LKAPRGPDAPGATGSIWSKLAWFGLIWVVSVLALFVVAYAIRGVIR
jgi:hypothetical protein